MPTQISDLSAEQQQQLAMQEGAQTPEDMITVLRMLAQDPENLARALQMMGLNIDEQDVQQAADWMEQSAASSAGMPPGGEQQDDVASAAAGDAAPPGGAPAATPDAQAEDPAEEGAEAPGEPDIGDAEQAQAAGTPADMAAAQGGGAMPRGVPGAAAAGMPSMDDVVSDSVMKGADAPTPQLRGGKNLAALKGPATPKVAGGGSAAGPSDYQNTIRNIFRQAQGGGGAGKGPRTPTVKGAPARAR